MGMIINPYLVQPSGPSYGALTTAWISATGETDLTILGALNTLESDLTTYGLTSKMKALYPFVGGTSTKHSYNFMNTSQYQLTFNGGWTHSSTGALPNGTNAYANTGLIPSSVLTESSKHLSFYQRTDNTPSSADPVTMGSYASGGGQDYMLAKKIVSVNTIIAKLSSIDTSNSSQSTIKAFHLVNRVSTTNKLFFNGTSIQTATGSGSNAPSSIYIGALNFSGAYGYTNDQLALVSIGDGLTDTEAANFYTAVQAFQTTLSRNV